MSLQKAIEYARRNPILPVGRNSISRFAAVLTSGPVEIVGSNSYKTHPLQRRFGCNDASIHLHAEIDGIVRATRWLAKDGAHYSTVTDLSDFSMYIARVLKDGSPALARPCRGCQRAILAFGIKNVEWTV